MEDNHFTMLCWFLLWVSEVAQLCMTLCDPWIVAYQVPPSMGLFRQEYWSGLPFPSPGDLPNPGIKPGSPTLQADALPSEPPGKVSAIQHRKSVHESESPSVLSDSLWPHGLYMVHGTLQARVQVVHSSAFQSHGSCRGSSAPTLQHKSPTGSTSSNEPACATTSLVRQRASPSARLKGMLPRVMLLLVKTTNLIIVNNLCVAKF